MVSSIKFSPIRRIGLWLVGLIVGVFVFGISAVSAGTTPAISTATGKAGATLRTIVVEFNTPVWTDSGLTTGLVNDATTDFTFTNGNAGGATAIIAVTHTAGDDFAIITVDADIVAGDITGIAGADTIAAKANGIFTVGGALSQAAVLLTADAGTVPAISSVAFLETGTGGDRILVTFNKRVWSDAAASPPTTAVAVADFTLTTGNGAVGCQSLAAALLSVAGARRVVLHCQAAAAAGDVADTLNAASGAAVYDAFGNAMLGTGGPTLTRDSTAPTFTTGIEAVKDGTQALVYFSEPVFTDEPAVNTNPGVIATGDFTYTDGGSTAGGTGQSAVTPGGSSRFMLVSTKFYGLMTISGAATSIADLLGTVGNDDTLDAAGATSVYDATGTAMATGGTVANRTLTDTTDPVILSVTLNKTGATGQNTLAILYSEDVQATGFTAGGESIASTISVGDMTTACTPIGFGAFSGNSGNLTYATLLNTVALNAAQTTFTITLAAQTGGYRTSTAAAAHCTDNTGDTFTPTAIITDFAPITVNTIETTSIITTHTITAAWDVANPLTAQVTTASSATTTTATIGWTAVTDAGTDFRDYRFFYGTTTGSGASLAGTKWDSSNDTALDTTPASATTTTTITSLNSGTIYFITPYVFDTFGNAAAAAAEMNIQTNSSSVTDRTAPAAPTAVTVKSEGGKAVLAWIDPTASDLKDIVVLRGKAPFPVSGSPYALVVKGVKTYTDSDVVVGDVIKYILRGRDNANNESANSTEVSVTIVAAAPPAATPPEAPAIEPPPIEPPPVIEPPQLTEAQIEIQQKIEKLEASIEKLEVKIAKTQTQITKLSKKKAKIYKKKVKALKAQKKRLKKSLATLEARKAKLLESLEQ